MVEVKPFQALRFDYSKVESSKVVSPPYDVISDPQREELYRKDPNNIIRVEYPKPEREDLSGEEKYVRAKTALQEMISKGVLTQDSEPAFYLYEQIFRPPDSRKRYSRIGIFGIIKLDEFENGNVIPHEKTHRAAKEDRFKLLKETQANTSPIFGLYEDPDSIITEIYDSGEATLLTEFIDDAGDRHALFKISDPKRVAQIEKLFEDKKVVIADGHHRYETALAYQAHVDKLGTKCPEDDYTMICLVEWDEPGLLIQPIHRILRNFGKMSRVEFLVRLKHDFILKEISLQHVPQVVKELERDFVVYMGGNYAYHAMLKDPDILQAELPAGKPEVWYDLTVTWFDHFIANKILSLDEHSFEKTVGYTSSYKNALTEVTAGTARAAFLFAPTQKSEMREIIKENQLMPQKSTYFYPKLLTGLVIYPHFEPSDFMRSRREKPRDMKRGGPGARKFQVVSNIAAQIKADGERKAHAAEAKSEAKEEARVKAEAEAAEEANGEKPEAPQAEAEAPAVEKKSDTVKPQAKSAKASVKNKE